MLDVLDMFAQPAEITTTGRSVCDIAEDLRVATRDWFRALDDLGAAFRLRDATEAVEAMRDAWHADFGVYRGVLDEWCQAAKAAAAGYQTVDEYLAAEINMVYPQHGPM